MRTPFEHEQALDAWLKAWPLASALWRYGEYVPLSQMAWDGRVLDLGCGDGLFGAHLLAGADVVGVDMDRTALKVAESRGVYRQLLPADIHHLPQEDGAFDIVFANCVIEHTADPLAIFRESLRVLRPGGRIRFTVPSEHFGSLLFGSRLFCALGAEGAARSYSAFVNRRLVHHHVRPGAWWQEQLDRAGFIRADYRYYNPPLAAALFDLTGIFGMPSQGLQRITGRWLALPKGRIFARFIRHAVGDGEASVGAGLIVEARKPA